MKMWSTFNYSVILENLQKSQKDKTEWILWQSSTEGRLQFKALVEATNENQTSLEIIEGDKDNFKESESFYAHCPKNDILFKRENFQLTIEDFKLLLTFKSPSELKIKDRRRIERFNYRYQDFKTVGLKIANPSGEMKAHSFFLLDLSVSGLSFVAPQVEVITMEKGDKILISSISDQELPADHEAQIAYTSRFKPPEGIKDRQGDSELIKIGVNFTGSLESITYKSISSIIDKKQKKIKGLDCAGFNGLDHEEQMRIIKQVGEKNPILAANILDRVESLDKLRYLTPQMRQNFWLEINQDVLAAALRLSSKELIFDLLSEVSQTMREEFLFKLDTPKPASAINKAQDDICNFITQKEKSGEYVLSAVSFVKYV